ncbi:hemerythrin domain-containing protein [Rhizorhabdus argentea]|uniref:hemerythrin domain-containing protein n=1 Tax=Rhizorhabdus argentea TaxID=1387174 RepID=UPI0030EBD2A8
MTLRQILQSATQKSEEIIDKISNTSNQAVKTRESLFAELSDELSRYVELEERYILPILRKDPENKVLAADAMKGNKEIRSRLEELGAAPKDDDAFLAKIADLNKGLRQHVRDERKELLPAVLKVLSEEEAQDIASKIQDGLADAERARREARQRQADQARREQDAADQAAEARRKAERAQKAAEGEARRSIADAAETIEREAASAAEGVRNVAVDMAESAQRVTEAAGEAMAIYGGTARQAGDDMRVMIEASNSALRTAAEIPSAWMEWTSRMVRSNTEARQRLMACRTVKDLAETQRDIFSNALRDWMEGSSKLLDITQRASRQALRPLDARLH